METFKKYYWWIPSWLILMVFGISLGEPLITLSATLFPVIHLLTN